MTCRCNSFNTALLHPFFLMEIWAKSYICFSCSLNSPTLSLTPLKKHSLSLWLTCTQSPSHPLSLSLSPSISFCLPLYLSPPDLGGWLIITMVPFSFEHLSTSVSRCDINGRLYLRWSWGPSVHFVPCGLPLVGGGKLHVAKLFSCFSLFHMAWHELANCGWTKYSAT